ncbi:Ubiquitin-protein ligase [Mycena kentingensis (nom. inval.)]|nr:Ubiquitin-protein ligase [Mycena kentingensis (nom. inval.)]
MVDTEMPEADYTDDEEVDAEVFDDEVDPDNSIADKTVTVSVGEDGSKIEAQTPDGTPVATSSKEGLPYLSARAASTRASYASALKAKLTDWHLEFSLDDQPLPLDLTMYGAMHQHEMRTKTGALPPNLIWQGAYTVKFKKVAGPSPSTDGRWAKARSSTPPLSSLPDDAPHAKILKLLRVLQQLNTLEAERSVFVGDKAFVNNKLSAKLTRQLEEPMIVARLALAYPTGLDLPQHFPFLVPFQTRYNFLQSTSLRYTRLILKWQGQQARVQDTSRRDDGIGFLGRLQRQKVRIPRKRILESAMKVGTGLGPTLEFYSLVSNEFARKDLRIWRDADAAGAGLYVDHPAGLYPAPLSPQDLSTDGGQKRTQIFRVIGQFVAKAMLDSRIIGKIRVADKLEAKPEGVKKLPPPFRHQTIDPFKNFTSVIGPNGPGKSNLVDAISVVLGVKCAQLRISQLKDLVNRGRRLGKSGVDGEEEPTQNGAGYIHAGAPCTESPTRRPALQPTASPNPNTSHTHPQPSTGMGTSRPGRSHGGPAGPAVYTRRRGDQDVRCGRSADAASTARPPTAFPIFLSFTSFSKHPLRRLEIAILRPSPPYSALETLIVRGQELAKPNASKTESMLVLAVKTAAI